MNKSIKYFAAAVAGLAFAGATFAAHHNESEKPLVSTVTVKSLEAAAGKIADLAGAIPEDKYDWAPMEGVASVRGVLSHVTGANYFLANMLGTAPPEGVDPASVTEGADKSKLIAIYQASVAHAKKAIAGVSEEALAEEISYFGMTNPRASLVQVIADHQHEHLGQLIAYARSNEVVPPWSQ